jgi:hypothetical protein
MRRVHVHIDRLVLHGVDHADRRAVVAAIEQELTRRKGWVQKAWPSDSPARIETGCRLRG